jgi:hypothetical protein
VRDFSLHILDLIENSIQAKATIVSVLVEEDPEKDVFGICVEDNGSGLHVPTEVATDPFYTTNPRKRTGLGLSLFRAAAEAAAGSLTIGKSELGGTAVRAQMQLSHVDRRPLGDLAATLSSVVCTNPHIDLRCRLRVGDRQSVIQARRLADELPAEGCFGLEVARRVSAKTKAAMAALQVIE